MDLPFDDFLDNTAFEVTFPPGLRFSQVFWTVEDKIVELSYEVAASVILSCEVVAA